MAQANADHADIRERAMQPPESCRTWREAMAADARSRRVLWNIERDTCVGDHIEVLFFQGIEAAGPFGDPDEAWGAAKAVVYDGYEDFYCTGRPVGDGRFNHLVRFDRPDAWVYLLGEQSEATAGIRRQYAISGADWPSNLTARQREALCTELIRELQLGRPNRIVWVADADETPLDTDNFRHLLRCLGLPHFEDKTWTFILQYERRDVPEILHVPRSLDGIDWWPFWVQEDCQADTGLTMPTEEAGQNATGLPEAIHRSTLIRVQHVELKAIDE